jgi:hypothetical protein
MNGLQMEQDERTADGEQDEQARNSDERSAGGANAFQPRHKVQEEIKHVTISHHHNIVTMNTHARAKQLNVVTL